MNENKRADPKWEKLFNTPLSCFNIISVITRLDDRVNDL